MLMQKVTEILSPSSYLKEIRGSQGNGYTTHNYAKYGVPGAAAWLLCSFYHDPLRV